MAQLTNRSHITSSSFHDEKDNLKEKREQFGKVKLLLKDSNKAVDDMGKMDMSRKELVNVVRDYHNDVCTDGGSCMV